MQKHHQHRRHKKSACTSTRKKEHSAECILSAIILGMRYMGGEVRGDNKTPPQHNTSQVQQSCIVKNPSALIAIFSINILLVWFCHEFLFSTQIYKSSICSGCKQCRANVGNGTPHHLIGSRRRDRAQYLIFSNLSLTLQRYSF